MTVVLYVSHAAQLIQQHCSLMKTGLLAWQAGWLVPFLSSPLLFDVRVMPEALITG